MNRHARMSTRVLTAVIALAALMASTFAVVSPAAAAPDPRPRVLLISDNSTAWVEDVRSKLEATEGFAEVAAPAAFVGGAQRVPTLAELEPYDAVLFWTDGGFSQGVAMGDALADYVDGGGRVVAATFSNVSSIRVQGRLETGGYLPITAGGQQVGGASLVANVPDHPLLAGVATFHGGSSSYRALASLAPGATLVASWSDGVPLVAVRESVVALNFFPPSNDVRSDFWDASTDGVRLMTNALGGHLERAPGFTSAADASFTAGTAGSFTVATSGAPKASITQTGTLPTGLTFTDNGDGTATIAGTPAAQTGGMHTIDLTATNGIGADATQTVTLTVSEAPVVSSLPTAGFTVGTAASFAVVSEPGFPAATTLTATGDLPDGMTFTDNGDGTATIAGTPADGSAGSYPITVEADNGVLSTTQSLTLTVSRVAQTVTITSTAPDAVVGQTYAVTTTGGGSGNPIVVSTDSAAVCTVEGSTVTFRHPGACVIDADQAGNGRHAAASASQTVAVSAATTTTELTVKADSLIAKVAPQAPGAGVPTGTVTFSVDGAEVGSAPLVDGTATLAHRVESGKSRAVAAVYSGDGDFTASSGSTARQDPTITARVTSAKPRSAAGWYRTPVTVTFSCATSGADLTAACPKPVTLKANRAGQSVTRTILAADGGAATVTVGAINIDRVAPKVRIKGVRKGGTYPGQAPKARCVSKDKLSGIARCKVSKRVRGDSVTIKATAVDRAGNRRTTKVRYKVARFYVAGAPFRGGAYQVRDGRTYLVVALTSGAAKPEYFNAAPREVTPTASGSYLSRSGKQSGLRRYTIPVRMDRGMSRKGHWVLGVKTGDTLHRIAVKARR